MAPLSADAGRSLPVTGKRRSRMQFRFDIVKLRGGTIVAAVFVIKTLFKYVPQMLVVLFALVASTMRGEVICPVGAH
jgi:hypothetical protein